LLTRSNIIVFALRKSTVARLGLDERDAGPRRSGIASIRLRRKRAPAFTSPACAAQYSIESIGQTMLEMILADPKVDGDPQPKFQKSPHVISRQAAAILL
jgi:hypothetical protein